MPDDPKTYSLNNGGSAPQPEKAGFLQKLLSKDGQPVVPPGGDTTPPASGSAAAPAAGNAFTRLFGDKGPAPQVVPGAGAPGTTAPSVLPPPVTASLLASRPMMAKFEREAEESRKKTAKGLLTLSLLIAVGIYGFFYGQLNPNFTWFASQLGSNVAQQFDRGNAELQKTKTDLNLVNYRMARLWLDDINSQIDSFQGQEEISKSDSSTSVQKQNAAAELQILGAKIKKSLAEVQKILNQPMGIDVFSREPVTLEERENLYETHLKTELASQKAAVSSNVKLNENEIRIFDNVIRFVENKSFRNMLRSQDLAKISEDDFGKMLTRIREEGTDELSAIDKIRRKRLNWGELISNIHDVTRKADPLYGQGMFKTVGGFLFSAYSFDSKTGRVNISGVTQTSDSKTFSFISKLVDSIERSRFFKDIDFRSFSKSRNDNGDFSSSLNLEFSIQSGDDSRDDAPSASPSNANQ